jgi:hypothetical protein
MENRSAPIGAKPRPRAADKIGSVLVAIFPRGGLEFAFHQVFVPVLEHVRRDDPDPLATPAFDLDRFRRQLRHQVTAFAALVNPLMAVEIFLTALALDRVI